MSRKKRPFDLVGTKVGRWTLLSGEYKGVYRAYKCECTCGNIKVVRECSLTSGDSTSCGCLAKECASKRNTKHYIDGKPVTRHRLHNVWNNMNRRCNNPKAQDYHYYGGRGIQVCQRWSWDLPNYKGFENFLEDMWDTYKEGLEIDRIDNDGNYCPENCRWATRQEQIINSSRLLDEDTLITYNGRSMIASQWELEVGVRGKVISDRVNKLKWSAEKALTTPTQVKSKHIEYKGEYINYTKLFKNYTNICASLKRRGMNTDQLVHHLFRRNIYHKIGNVMVEVEPKEISCVSLDFTIKLTPLAEEIMGDE